MPEDKPMTKDNPISEVKEYFQFHTLPTRKENLLQRVEYGFENAGKLYDDHTLLLTQVLDRGDQQELLDQLKKDMSFAQTRGEKDTAKQRYWDSLASRSAFTALNEIGDKMEGNFSIGLKGGRKVDITQDYGDLNEIFSSLNNLSPNLLNTQLIWEAFKPVGPGDRRLWDLKEIFESWGLSGESPEFRLLLLAYLERGAKIHMMEPLVRAVNHYEDIRVRSSDGNDVGVKDIKKKILERIFLGDQKKIKGQFDPERFYGTEHFRGLFYQIQEQEKNLAVEIWQDNWQEGIFVVKLIAFLRTSYLRKDQAQAQIWGSLVQALSKRDFMQAGKIARETILDNPEIYSEWIWPVVGVTFEDIEAHQIELGDMRYLSEEERYKLQQTRIEDKRRELARQYDEDRLPELWFKIEPYAGKTGVDRDGNPVKIIKKAERFSRQKGIFKKIPGYVHVFTGNNGFATYGAIWRRIESGEWIFSYVKNF